MYYIKLQQSIQINIFLRYSNIIMLITMLITKVNSSLNKKLQFNPKLIL